LALGEAGPAEIDAAGMTVALRRAAVRALEALPARPDTVLLDGAHDYIGRPWPVRCAVRADLRSVSVAAASVIAKVHRDRLMAGLGPEEFAFAENAGYPSPAHQEALAALGPTPHHRLSWSYLDDLPRWRHLKRHRPDVEGSSPCCNQSAGTGRAYRAGPPRGAVQPPGCRDEASDANTTVELR
jgi:ribonuclease HII